MKGFGSFMSHCRNPSPSTRHHRSDFVDWSMIVAVGGGGGGGGGTPGAPIAPTSCPEAPASPPAPRAPTSPPGWLRGPAVEASPDSRKVFSGGDGAVVGSVLFSTSLVLRPRAINEDPGKEGTKLLPVGGAPVSISPLAATAASAAAAAAIPLWSAFHSGRGSHLGGVVRWPRRVRPLDAEASTKETSTASSCGKTPAERRRPNSLWRRDPSAKTSAFALRAIESWGRRRAFSSDGGAGLLRKPAPPSEENASTLRTAACTAAEISSRVARPPENESNRSSDDSVRRCCVLLLLSAYTLWEMGRPPRGRARATGNRHRTRTNIFWGESVRCNDSAGGERSQLIGQRG